MFSHSENRRTLGVSNICLLDLNFNLVELTPNLVEFTPTWVEFRPSVAELKKILSEDTVTPTRRKRAVRAGSAKIGPNHAHKSGRRRPSLVEFAKLGGVWVKL